MASFNIHSVFTIAERDVETKVVPLIEKLLADLEAGLKGLGFTHEGTKITTDKGVTNITTTPPETFATTNSNPPGGTVSNVVDTAETEGSEPDDDQGESITSDAPPVIPSTS